MSGLDVALLAGTEPAPGPSVLDSFPKIRAVIEATNPEQREAILGVLAGPLPTSEDLGARLASLGYPVSPPQIRAYRRAVRRQETS